MTTARVYYHVLRAKPWGHRSAHFGALRLPRRPREQPLSSSSPRTEGLRDVQQLAHGHTVTGVDLRLGFVGPWDLELSLLLTGLGRRKTQ